MRNFIIFVYLCFPTLIHASNLRQSINQAVQSITDTISNIQGVYQQKTPILPEEPVKPQVLSDAALFSKIPPVLMIGEVLQVQGEVNALKLSNHLLMLPPNTKTYYLTLAFINNATGSETLFTQQLKINNRRFVQQCFFTQPGSYFFGLFIGKTGVFTPKIYEVKETSKFTSIFGEQQNLPIPNLSPENLIFTVEDNQLYIKWVPKSKLTKITFSQIAAETRNISFVISNDIGQFKVPYAQFKNFHQVQTLVEIMHAQSADSGAYERTTAFSAPLSKAMNVSEHRYREIKHDMVEVSGEIPSKVDVNSTIKIEGVSTQKMDQLALVVSPNKQIAQSSITGDIMDGKHILPDRKFQFELTIEEEGIYIIEINHANGFALINTPVYAGSSFPLLPDYSDLYSREKKIKQDPRNITNQKNKLISLINEKRAQFGAPPVQLDAQLQKLAQAHSEDMAAKNYVSHTSKEGLNAGERGRKMGIFTPIGQNIALNEDLEYAHYRLCRSPAHLKNIIDRGWTRVGVGISQQVNGNYYITQQFSTPDISTKAIGEHETIAIQQQLLEGIQKNFPVPLKFNSELTMKISQWFQQNSSPNLSGLQSIISEAGVFSGRLVSVSLPYVPNFVDLIQKSGYFQYANLSNVALAVKLAKGLMEIMIIYY